MSYLLESPIEGYDEGERVALVDGFTPEYQSEAQRVPANGITLDAARRILKGKKWVGLRNWACYIYQATGNWFLDTDQEMRSNMQIMEWDKETVEAMSKEWLQAQAFYDKMMDFAGWLEDEKEGPSRFKQTIDFILAHFEEGDVSKEV